MSIREEQCNKVCRILDDVLANRPTERDSLIVAVRKAFEALELFGNSEPLPPAHPERKTGKWITKSTNGEMFDCCSVCGYVEWDNPKNFCPNCGSYMKGDNNVRN